MAIKRAVKDDYKRCEFCKMNPCFLVATKSVEYGDRCRHYTADTKKIKNERAKRERKSYSFLQ